MNIAFWSASSGRGATSGNMLAVSVMASLVYSVEGILLQFDYCSRSIDDVFSNRKNTNLLMEEYAYYNQKGIDTLLDRIQIRDIDINDINENTVPVRNTLMKYIPASRRIKSGLNDREMINSTKLILKLLNQTGDVNFIDCINGEKTVSKALLKSADVVVVNICQGMDIDRVIRDKELMKKAVFLVGRYDAKSNENLSVIRKKYGINRENIAVIPYNIGFHDAIQEGKVVPYITKYLSVKRNDDNFNFINDVFRATGMILRKAGYDEKSNV